MSTETDGEKAVLLMRRMYAKHLKAATYHHGEAKRLEAALSALGRPAATSYAKAPSTGGRGRNRNTPEKLATIQQYVRDRRAQGGKPTSEDIKRELKVGDAVVHEALKGWPRERVGKTGKAWMEPDGQAV